MKRLISLYFFLLPFYIHAQQIDSFSVAGKSLKFSVPTDWVMDFTDSSVSPNGNWNLSIRHSVHSECKGAKIMLRINSRFNNLSTSKQNTVEKPDEVIFDDSATLPHIQLIYNTRNGDCDLKKERITADIFYLNDTLLLTFILNTILEKPLIDSMQHTYDQFIKNFLELNNSYLGSFSSFKSFTNNIGSDTLNFEIREITIWHPLHWKIEKKKGSSFLISPDKTVIEVSYIKNQTVTENGEEPFIENSGIKLYPISVTGYKLYASYKTNFVSPKKPFYFIYNYYYNYDDPVLGKGTLLFSMKLDSKNAILDKFYKTTFENFIVLFISENQF